VTDPEKQDLYWSQRGVSLDIALCVISSIANMRRIQITVPFPAYVSCRIPGHKVSFWKGLGDGY
jgi:hypothetical protein